MRIELTRVGLLFYLANYYTTRGAQSSFEVSKFELQLRYNIHFWTNTLEKGMNSLISPAVGQIVQLLLFYKDDFDIK